MFNDNKEAREALSFLLNEEEIARYATVMKHIKGTNSTTLSDEQIDQGLAVLAKVTQLKLGASFYA